MDLAGRVQDGAFEGFFFFWGVDLAGVLRAEVGVLRRWGVEVCERGGLEYQGEGASTTMGRRAWSEMANWLPYIFSSSLALLPSLFVCASTILLSSTIVAPLVGQPFDGQSRKQNCFTWREVRLLPSASVSVKTRTSSHLWAVTSSRRWISKQPMVSGDSSGSGQYWSHFPKAG